MSGGHFDSWRGGIDVERLNGSWRDEELNDLFFDLFGGGYDGYRTPFARKDRTCEFGPRGGGLFESLDFWLSGDTCEEDYMEDLKRFKQKWFRRTPKNRVEYYQRRFEEYAHDIIEQFKEELVV